MDVDGLGAPSLCALTVEILRRWVYLVFQEASSQHGPNRLQALKKVVKSSLRQLSDRGMNGNILFPIPAHWAKQTGKLSRGAKRKLERFDIEK